MNDLQKEAEEYAKRKSSSDVFREVHINDFIAGATSKFVQAKIIKARIEGLSLALSDVIGIPYRMQELEEQLKLIKDGKAN